MKLITEQFKEVVNNVVKGCGNNSLLPITSMIGIRCEDGELNFVSTDGTNTLIMTMSDSNVNDEFNITVESEVFSKLVPKLTTKDVELNVVEGNLVIKSNGVYKLPLVTDGEGEVEFPIPDITEFIERPKTIVKASDILSVYSVNKSALATTFENPFLTGYYVDNDMVVTSDANVITFNEINLNIRTQLLNPQMVNLLALSNEKEFEFYEDDKYNVMFTTDNMTIVGKELEGLSDYPINDMKPYLNESFKSCCKVSKTELMNALSRLELFIEPYDKNGAYFSFDRTTLTLTSKKSSVVEKVKYRESKDFEKFICCVDIPQMKEQLTAYPEDIVELYYGLDNALKLTSGKITQVISLLEDEDLDN